MTSVFGPPPAGQFQIEFARAWLHGHGIHAQPTRFVAMRLTGQGPIRYQEFTNRHPVAFGVFAAVWVAVFSALSTWAPDYQAWHSTLLYAIFFAIRVWFNHEQAVGERSLAAALPRRVARPVAPKWTDFLNGWVACALVLTYLGGFGMAAGLFALGELPAGGVLAGMTLLGVAAATWQTRRALNRPALAEDALSLLVDDRLRADEMRSATFPVMMVFAFSVTTNFTDLVAVQLSLAGLLIVSMVCWFVGRRRLNRAEERRVGAP